MISKPLLFGVLAMVFWGGWSILASHAVSYSTTGRVVVLTYFVGFVTVGAIRFGEVSATGYSAYGLALSVGSGLLMSVGTLAFYQGLDGGDLSVVPALSGLYFVVAAVYGIVILGEPANIKKTAGLLFAGVAVALLTD